METKLEYQLLNSHKAEMISYMKSNPKEFDELIKLALADKHRYSWRAAWLLWSCIDKNDQKLRNSVKRIIDVLPKKNDNQQRELLKILQQMEINSEYEGQLFDTCMNIWKSVDKNPSLRWNAFKLLVAISKRHPDLSAEMSSLTESHYVNTLSESVKKSIVKLTSELNHKTKQKTKGRKVHQH